MEFSIFCPCQGGWGVAAWKEKEVEWGNLFLEECSVFTHGRTQNGFFRVNRYRQNYWLFAEKMMYFFCRVRILAQQHYKTQHNQSASLH